MLNHGLADAVHDVPQVHTECTGRGVTHVITHAAEIKDMPDEAERSI